jgi:hypothetical protein
MQHHWSHRCIMIIIEVTGASWSSLKSPVHHDHHWSHRCIMIIIEVTGASWLIFQLIIMEVSFINGEDRSKPQTCCHWQKMKSNSLLQWWSWCTGDFNDEHDAPVTSMMIMMHRWLQWWSWCTGDFNDDHTHWQAKFHDIRYRGYYWSFKIMELLHFFCKYCYHFTSRNLYLELFIIYYIFVVVYDLLYNIYITFFYYFLIKLKKKGFYRFKL